MAAIIEFLRPVNGVGSLTGAQHGFLLLQNECWAIHRYSARGTGGSSYWLVRAQCCRRGVLDANTKGQIGVSAGYRGVE